MEDLVQPLNYSAHAIEELSDYARRIAAMAPQSSRSNHKVSELLQRAVKFLLPNCADLVDLHGLTEHHLDMLRLPYPVVALEVPWKPDVGRFIAEGPMQEAVSSKRIVLAWDETFASEPQALTADRGEEGVYMVSVYFDDNVKRWLCSALGAFIPRENTVSKYSDAPSQERLSSANQLMLDQGWAKPGNPSHIVEYFLVQPELFSELASRMGLETARTRLQLDLMDELLSLWQFCLTVNCHNVTAVDMLASEALNKKRIRAGKQPFFSYKVLQLPEPSASRSGKPGFQQEGQRTPPRMHLRRGHPRRLPTGKMTYVRAAIIGSAELGQVDKAYSLQKRGTT